MPDAMSDAQSLESGNYTQHHLLQQLHVAASGSKAAFCCSGSVPISQESPFEKIKDNLEGFQLSSPPVIIRWDEKDGENCSKVTLPPKPDQDCAKDQIALANLVHACTPASFGKDGEDVLDESYRKAAKLDSHQFSTNFSPYDVGIIATVTQTLLPGIAKPLADEKQLFVENLGVVAELQVECMALSLPPRCHVLHSSFFVQVYSAPSGMFKPHVDTPRGATQFGSLVVCLPCRHQGGALRISHGQESHKQETILHWGGQDAMIQWAAFYSDCEHEVKEVIAGHRITLTYNLYVHEQLGGIFRNPSPVHNDSFTLYCRAKEALSNPDFFPKGGTLGFHCEHAYAHANSKTVRTLPFALKGIDAIIFSIFADLGIPVSLRAVMKGVPSAYGPDMKDLRREERQYYEDNSETHGAELVATSLRGMKITDHAGNTELNVVEGMLGAWRSNWRQDIQWFGRPGNREIAVVQLVYGNQASIAWHYSTAAILVEIPDKDSQLRQKLME
ncbi:MAG: hypothetical protein Q9172_006955 [Xanthocarpia lactea]